MIKRKIIALIIMLIFILSTFNTALASTASNMDDIFYNKPNDYRVFEKEIEKYPKAITIKFPSSLCSLYWEYALYNNVLCEFIYDYNSFHYDSNYNIVAENKSYISDRKKIKKSLKILNKVKVSGNTITKAKKIRKWLNKRITYSKNASKGIYAVCTRKGSCQAFSKCYKYLCNKNGIKCETVHSKYHMWNIVKIKGVWYNVEPQQNTNEKFLVSDKKLINER